MNTELKENFDELLAKHKIIKISVNFLLFCEPIYFNSFYYSVDLSIKNLGWHVGWQKIA